MCSRVPETTPTLVAAAPGAARRRRRSRHARPRRRPRPPSSPPSRRPHRAARCRRTSRSARAPRMPQRPRPPAAAASAKPHAAAALSQPVSAAQAEALGPALGPAAESEQNADPTDYSVAKDGTIRVAAAETSVTTPTGSASVSAAARASIICSSSTPVLIGQRIKLDFAAVTPEEFETRRREYHRGCRRATSPRTASSAPRSTSRVAGIRSGR